MPTWKTIAFTTTEIKALWLAAVEGRARLDYDGDRFLADAADVAIDKLWRVEKGMPRKANPEPRGGRKPGAPLDLRRPA